MHAAFHALLVRKLLRGEIDLMHWGNETQSFSSILVNDGQQLGKVCMDANIPAPAKAPQYLQLFISTHVQLNRRWKEQIGLGNATGKI